MKNSLWACSSTIALACALNLAACSDSGVPSPATVPPIDTPPTTPKLVCAPISLPLVHGALTPLDVPPPAYDWQGNWQSCEVLFPSRLHGSMLHATLFAPGDLSTVRGRLPVVVIAPGSETGVQANYHWSARELASAGYLTLTVNPQGISYSELVAYQQTIENYMDAVTSSLDFMESAQNPLRGLTDTARMGAAGHSLSAFALSLMQADELRLQAIVAWDGLVKAAAGDDSSAIGPSPVSDVIGSFTVGEVPLLSAERPVLPRIPALSEVSDDGQTQNPDPELKKTAYTVWREAGVSAMVISFLGKSHLDWGQAATAAAASDSPKSIELRRFQYFTRAWFDFWLKGDRSAVDRLTASTLLGEELETIYTPVYRSAIFLPGMGIDCPDIYPRSCAAFQD
ncbi:MAG: hypothetical protein V4650_01440 [Pseudomonadota bacterium]